MGINIGEKPKPRNRENCALCVNKDIERAGFCRSYVVK